MSRRTFLMQASALIASPLPVFKMPEPTVLTFHGIPIIFSSALSADDFIIVTPAARGKIGAMSQHAFDERWFCTRCGHAAEHIVDRAMACAR
jgi:hypothetical protein